MRVGVITGGATAERHVAFAGAAQIVEALRSRGHTVAVVDTVTGALGPAEERRLLVAAVGREPPAVAPPHQQERPPPSRRLPPPPAGDEAGRPCLCPPPEAR